MSLLTSNTPYREDCFYGKILLFGEYTVLLGGHALAAPLGKTEFSGVLKVGQDRNTDPMWHLWYEYLYKNYQAGKGELEFDWSRFEKEIQAGLFFESGIPVGYGIGSSGALTAAVFNRYVSPQQLNQLSSKPESLKKYLSVFESFFHGSSSGLDPLVSLLECPLCIRPDGLQKLSELKLNCFKDWYLLNSGIPRQTSTLVRTFQDNVHTNSQFASKMETLTVLNNKVIQAYIQQNHSDLSSSLQQISTLQRNEMKWLIPHSIVSIWDKGLSSGKFFLKLCGAGGGGYYLLYAKDPLILSEIKDKFQLVSLEN